MKTQSFYTIASHISFSLALSVISFAPLTALDVPDDALSLNISCSQALQTVSMQKLLTSEGHSAERLPSRVEKGINIYTDKLSKFSARQLNDIILSDTHIRIIKDTAEHAYLMNSEGVQQDDLYVESVVRPIPRRIVQTGYHYSVKPDKQTILSHNFISKTVADKSYNFQAALKYPHILIERQANNDEEGTYSTKVYACTETML